MKYYRAGCKQIFSLIVLIIPAEAHAQLINPLNYLPRTAATRPAKAIVHNLRPTRRNAHAFPASALVLSAIGGKAPARDCGRARPVNADDQVSVIQRPVIAVDSNDHRVARPAGF